MTKVAVAYRALEAPHDGSEGGRQVAPAPRRNGRSAALLFLLAALLGVRLYAALATVTVRTWDDIEFRASVEWATSWVDAHGGATALPGVCLTPRSLLTEDARRSGGYLFWLVAARELLSDLEPERAYQLANVALLLLQLALVYALFRPASHGLALAASVLYLTMPFVFGVNRWVWTENHIMLALLAYAWAGAWLLGKARESWPSEGVAGLAAGAACALASMTREYVAPSIALVPVVIAMALLLRKRFVAVAAFAAPVAIYAVPFVEDVVAVARVAVWKATERHYYHSVAELLLHSTRHVAGFPVTILIVAGLGAAVVAAWRGREAWRIQPLVPLLWAHLALLVVYGGLIVWSTNRISRGMVPIVWTAIGGIAIAARVAGFPAAPWRRWLAHGLTAAVVAAVSILGYDLFVAFDGGQGYAAHAYQLGTFNHPLWLGPPRGPDGMHVVIP